MNVSLNQWTVCKHHHAANQEKKLDHFVNSEAFLSSLLLCSTASVRLITHF